MKPALKIEVSRKAGLTLVTTEDGVFGLMDSAVDDPIGLMVLKHEDYTDTGYTYFPEFVLPRVMDMCKADLQTVYTMPRH